MFLVELFLLRKQELPNTPANQQKENGSIQVKRNFMGNH